MKWKMSLAAMLSVLLIVLSGCQSVGGVDITNLINRSADVVTAESQGSLKIKLDVKQNANLSEEETKMIALINGFEVNVHSKVQSADQMSIQANLKMGGKELPIQLSMDGNSIAAVIDGAKDNRPILLPIDDMEGLGIDNETALKVQKSLIQFFTKHAPNPKVTTVTPVTETIFGESQSLNKVHMEFGADETLDWVSGLLKSIIADEQGTKATIQELVKLYAPIIEQSMASEDMSSEYAMFKDGEVLATIAYKWLKENGETTLAELKKEWDQAVKESPEVAVVLSNKTKLTLDLYADSSLNLKKNNMELQIALPDSEYMPITGITIQASSEMKDINKPVKADIINTSNAAVVDKDLVTPGQWLRFFKSDSLAYQLLKDMGISQKYIFLDLSEDDYDDSYMDAPAPFIHKGVTMVPIRYVAERLDADVTWDSATKSVRIIDDITGSTIIVKLNSTVATVDGKQQHMNSAPITKDNSVYIPLRAVAELLGVEVNYIKSEYGDYVTLERD